MKIKDGVINSVEIVKDSANALAEKIDVTQIITAAAKTPGAKIDRAKFLRKELSTKYPADQVAYAIAENPAHAGIDRSVIDTLAKQAIDYETNKVSALSFLAGIPGGIAMAATIPLDLTQYFVFILRIMQKLAYLYGFEDFELNEDSISEETLNKILIFLGVMFGVSEASAGLKIIADVAAHTVAKRLERAALTKGIIYPIVKKVAAIVGAQMNKQIFAKAVGSAIPIAGGVVIGGISHISFRVNANRLKRDFQKLPISDVDFYSSDKQNN